MSKKNIVRNISRMRDYGFEDDNDTKIKPCETCIYRDGIIFKLKHFTKALLVELMNRNDTTSKMKEQMNAGCHCVCCNDDIHNEWIQIEGKAKHDKC